MPIGLIIKQKNYSISRASIMLDVVSRLIGRYSLSWLVLHKERITFGIGWSRASEGKRFEQHNTKNRKMSYNLLNNFHNAIHNFLIFSLTMMGKKRHIQTLCLFSDQASSSNCTRRAHRDVVLLFFTSLEIHNFPHTSFLWREREQRNHVNEFNLIRQSQMCECWASQWSLKRWKLKDITVLMWEKSSLACSIVYNTSTWMVPIFHSSSIHAGKIGAKLLLNNKIT